MRATSRHESGGLLHVSADGEMLFVPQQGVLTIVTEIRP
jgi:homogentisate 1,2-dioxygenase